MRPIPTHLRSPSSTSSLGQSGCPSPNPFSATRMNERLTLSVLAQGLIAAAYVSVAAASGDAHGNAFAPWARATRLDAENLAALGTLIGDRRVVAFTEGVHAAAEPLEYRNRV